MNGHTIPASLRGAAAALLVGCVLGSPSRATVLTGGGGRGVPVGQSSLISTLDYSDTFTGNEDGGPVPDRVYGGLRDQSAYQVENTYGNPAHQLTSQRFDSVTPARPFMSFAADKAGTPGLVNGVEMTYPGPSGAGSNTGFTQFGGGAIDYGIPYGLRDQYVVQVDAVAVTDRVDISSGEVPGTIGPGTLSVFFRGPGFAEGGRLADPTHRNNISLFNGTTDTNLRSQPGYENLNTGLSDVPNAWHSYAVRFDRTNNEIEIFLDEVSVATVDLTTFAGGLYANFSNAAVGVGANAGDRLWSDNFQVGAPAPEPSAAGLLGLAALVLTRRRPGRQSDSGEFVRPVNKLRRVRGIARRLT